MKKLYFTFFACCLLFAFLYTCRPKPKFMIDHFKVYNLDSLAVDYEVTLKDQFHEDPRIDTLYSLSFFANPVSKNGRTIKDTTAHLTWYRIKKPSPTEPEREWSVTISNQLHTRNWILSGPDYLLVPTEKIEPGSTFPENLDHFLCYTVRGPEPRLYDAKLEDQFDKKLGKIEDVIIKEPMFFCTPVEKNDKPINNKIDHLACYHMTSKTDYPPISVIIENQFGRDTLNLQTSYMLCVPSRKLKFEEITGQ